MAGIKPFYCMRPAAECASRVAALPYDVYNREEAKSEVEREPLSFLRIDRAETSFPDDVDTYDERVYARARELMAQMEADGIFVTEEVPCYYLYELTMDGHTQTGITACSSVDDYLNQIVKKHENTRADKEVDRIRHVDVTDAQTGPIFLAYRASGVIKKLEEEVKKEEALYDFTSPDGVRHRVFKIARPEWVSAITEEFSHIPHTYIADGHHRAASAVKVALKRREERPEYTGEEEFNYFLSVLFPDDELQILSYNRVVKDLNGLGTQEFLDQVRESFEITGKIERKAENPAGKTAENTVNTENAGCDAYSGKIPARKGEICMLLDGAWYTLKARESIMTADPVKGLDVSLLQEHLLTPILGIGDPRTDKRIEFIGGIRGTKELEKRVDTDMAVAFSMYPTSMAELLSVADAGLLMPPKSTWFEPKLRSGLFIHKLS
ncbi:DUF1015 domain-containing protein [uncultured Clostridium sp.]|uniref:DUF1015 domain-containing protein n=1 Tax=uncultured Clostridium sp. TaxID=59620 RepID=UPI0025E83FA9|nr:DUF1015 family protein [uncultured Clostridium sp.]